MSQTIGDLLPEYAHLAPILDCYLGAPSGGWCSDPHRPDGIVGAWCEDGVQYTISCPEQLRDLIAELPRAFIRIAVRLRAQQEATRFALKRLDTAETFWPEEFVSISKYHAAEHHRPELEHEGQWQLHCFKANTTLQRYCGFYATWADAFGAYEAWKYEQKTAGKDEDAHDLEISACDNG
jgi:hypothetical protein